MDRPHKLVNGVRVDLSDEEIAQREVDRLAWEAEKLADKWKEDRIAAYVAKGWKDVFDVIDDMAERGSETVLAERRAIKARYPKGVK